MALPKWNGALVMDPERGPASGSIVLAAMAGSCAAHVMGGPEPAVGEVVAPGLGLGIVLPWLDGVVGMLVVAALGVASGALARRLDLSMGVSALAAALVAVSPCAGAALVGPAGAGLTASCAAGVAMLALAPREGATSGVATWAARFALGLAAVWLSSGAWWPLLFLAMLVPKGRSATRGRLLRVGLPVVVLGALVLFVERLPALGYGFGFVDGPSNYATSDAQPAPAFASALIQATGLGGELPWLTPGRWLAPLSPWIGASLLFVLLVVPSLAGRVRERAVRFGGLMAALGAFAAMLVALTSTPAAVSTATLLPSVVGLSLMIASLAQSPTKLMQVMGWTLKPALGLAVAAGVGLAWLAQSARLGVHDHRAWTRQVQRVDPSLTYGASTSFDQLADQGVARVEPLRRMILSASPSVLPPAVELDAGMRVLSDLESLAGLDEALAWCEQWSTSRASRGFSSSLPALEAETARLRLLTGDVDAALDVLGLDGTLGQSDRLLAAVTLMRVFDARASDAALVERLVPVADALLRKESEQAGDAGVDALLTLADLRARQSRFIDGIRAAEEAGERRPDDPRPLLMEARIYLRNLQREDGLLKIQEAKRLAPNDPMVRFMEGRMLTTLSGQAETGARRMIALWEEAGDRAGSLRELEAGLVAAAEALTAAGRAADARRLLGDAMRRLPLRRGLLLADARAAHKELQWDDAVARLEELLADQPDHVDGRSTLAEVLRDAGFRLLLQGQRDLAVERFRRALALNAKGVDPGGMQSVVDSYDGRRGTRSPDEMSPSDARSLAVAAARVAFDDGIEAFRNGDLEAARDLFVTSVEHLPDNPLAQLNLGRVELELANYSKAEKALRYALDLGDLLDMRADVEHAWLLLARARAITRPEALRDTLAGYVSRFPDGGYREQIEALASQDG